MENRNLRGLRVLFAEDNPFTQKLLAHLLTQLEAVVEIARNGLEAVDMIKINRYDVVIMDIMMPELDGYTATRMIREMEEEYFKTLPIFACTAIADADLAAEAGMTGQISKSPIEKEELLKKLSPYCC